MSELNPLFIDFEYFGSKEYCMNIICAATMHKGEVKTFWLDARGHNDLEAFKKHLVEHKTLVAYNAIAEARALMSLGIDPFDFDWIDCYLEYRGLLNGNNTLSYGKQLIKGRPITTSFIPKWERTEEQSKILKFSPPEYGLAPACYKLLDVIINTKHKDKMRNLILSQKRFNNNEKKLILEYCASDTIYLPELWEKMQGIWTEKIKRVPMQSILNRGNFAIHSALMEARGYPIILKYATNLKNNILPAITDLCEDINSQFPGIFVKNRKGEYVRKSDAIYAYMDKYVPKKFLEKWPLTPTKKRSLSLSDAWEKFYTVRYDFERNNFAHQLIRFLKLSPNLRSLREVKKKPGDYTDKSFWDFVGKDGRVRTFSGIYGSQTSRSQPKAMGFLMAKPAWMRSLILPKKGKMIIGVDCSAQEFLLSGILSQDDAMVKAYASGDPYTTYGKMIGKIPPEGTKHTHKKVRDLLKRAVLAILYGMGPNALANVLNEISGTEDFDLDDGEEFLEDFYDVFYKFELWKDEILEKYSTKGALFLADGWPMWADNDNERSIINYSIQGNGSVIMREAIKICHERGLKVIMSQHDAIYIETKLGDWDALNTLKMCWVDAFNEIFPKNKYKYFTDMRCDGKIWGIGVKEQAPKNIKADISNLYLDGRGLNDFKFFKKYFQPAT